MAKNVKINGVTYDSVPYVSIPNASGSGTASFYDTGAASVSAGDLRKGVTAYGAAGEVQGNLESIAASTTEITAKAQEVSIPAGIHGTGSVVKISAADQALLIASNIKSGITVLGVAGGLSSATVSQDASTKVLSIS